MNNIKFKYRIEDFVFSVVIFVFKLLPFRMMKVESYFLSILFKIIGRRHSKIVEKNLKIAFKDKTEREIKKLKDKIYKHFSEMFVCILNIFSKKGTNDLLDRVDVKNLSVITDALKKNRGVILFSAHFGNWEIIPYILKKKMGKDLHSVARKMDNPLIEKKVKDFREFMGSRIIHKKGSLRKILGYLKENELIYLLIDQNAIKREAVEVEFFSNRVLAIPMVSKLHIRQDIPIVPVFLHYEGNRVVLDIQDEIKFAKTDDSTADIKKLTQECIHIFEEKIKQYPEQWFWFHNRWKRIETK